MKLIFSWAAQDLNDNVFDDDVEVKRTGWRIVKSGIDVLTSWLGLGNGSMIYEAGTEGAAEIPAEIVDELPRIFDQVMAAWKNEVSVGVGATLGDSKRALKIAQGRGGNRIIMWSEDYMQELSRELGSDEGEEDEQGDFFDDEREDTDQGKTTGLQRSEIWDEDSINNLMNALGDDWMDLTMKLQKDEVTPEEASAIEGPQSPASAPEGGGAGQAQGPESAMSADGVTAGSEGTAPAGSPAGDGGGKAPKGKKAPASHEEAFHQAAGDEDARQRASETPQRQELKQQVVQSLTKIKEAAPKLEALKQQAPDMYQTVLDIIETMSMMATEIVNEEQPDPEEEEEGSEEGDSDKKDDSSEDAKKSERGADGRFVSLMTKEEIAARECKHFYGKNGKKCLKCKEMKKDEQPAAADTGADPSGAGQGTAPRGPKGGFAIPESKIGF